VILKVELRASCLLHRCSTPCPSPFCSGYFGGRVLLYAQAGLDRNPLYLYFPCNWEGRCVLQCPDFIGWDTVSQNFL